MSFDKFSRLHISDQRRHLIELSRRAISEYSLEEPVLRPFEYEYNAVFRVSTMDCEYALKLYVGSRHRREEVEAEARWVNLVEAESEVFVPAVQPLRSGQLVGLVYSDQLEREVSFTLSEWQPGKHLQNITPQVARRLGEVLSLLHREAVAIPNEKFERPRYLQRIREEYKNLPNLQLYQEAIAKAEKAVSTISQPEILCHLDLYQQNFNFFRGYLMIHDFDEMAYAPPVYDLAHTAYHLRHLPNGPSLISELWKGYGDRGPARQVTIDEFEGILALRCLERTSVLASTTFSAVQGRVPEVLARSQYWLTNYLADNLTKPIAPPDEDFVRI